MRCEHVNKEKHIVLVLGNDHSKAGHLFVWRNAAQWTLNNHLSESREAPKDLWKRQSNKLYLLPKGSEAKKPHTSQNCVHQWNVQKSWDPSPPVYLLSDHSYRAVMKKGTTLLLFTIWNSETIIGLTCWECFFCKMLSWRHLLLQEQ